MRAARTLLTLLTLASAPALAQFDTAGLVAAPALCAGDCNADFEVRIDELTLGINIASGRATSADCPSFDRDRDGVVTVADLVTAVIHSLRGCPCSGTFDNVTCGGNCAEGSTCALSTTLLTCSCVPDHLPCGETALACNGECPDGTVCRGLDNYPYPECGCIDEGAAPCGQTGGGFCGGACPDGTECSPYAVSFFDGCVCLPPDSCDCPAGFYCGFVNPGVEICVPDYCSGQFPSCGGDCGPGKGCFPISSTSDFGFEACVCAPAGAPCGPEGVACPPGEICNSMPPGVLACVAE